MKPPVGVVSIFIYCSFSLYVADQLCAKYSKEYGKLCRTNQIGTVNDRVMNVLVKHGPVRGVGAGYFTACSVSGGYHCNVAFI